MGRCKSLGALKLFLEYVSFNYPGPVSCFLHPDSSSGYTEGEGWVVQVVYTGMAGTFFVY